jgi:hypothetical protein
MEDTGLTVTVNWREKIDAKFVKAVLRFIFPVLMLIPGYSVGQWHNEKYFQNVVAQQMDGKKEVTFTDRIRIDIITKDHAIEVEFADKWYQAVGQSLFYGIKTGLHPGIVLIMKKEVDALYLDRLKLVAIRHEITIYTLDYWSLKLTLVKTVKDGTD